MKILITGATGYIGGSVAQRLVGAGHAVIGLTRRVDKAAPLRALGVEPAVGSLDDARLLASLARSADAVVNAANSDHSGAVDALIGALEGTGKLLLHTSGSSIVGDNAQGELREAVFDEDTRFEPAPEKAARVAIDRRVLRAAEHGVRSVVLCNSLIYGRGLGLHPSSIQIPSLVDQARKSGVVRYVGPGLNVWSTVHIEDVADLYLRAIEGARAGSFYYVENGEASFKDMAAAIAAALGLGPAQSWSIEEAIACWGVQRAVFSLGSNSRVRADRARRELGWAPRHCSVLDWIRKDLTTAADKAPPVHHTGS